MRTRRARRARERHRGRAHARRPAHPTEDRSATPSRWARARATRAAKGKEVAEGAKRCGDEQVAHMTCPFLVPRPPCPPSFPPSPPLPPLFAEPSSAKARTKHGQSQQGVRTPSLRPASLLSPWAPAQTLAAAPPMLPRAAVRPPPARPHHAATRARASTAALRRRWVFVPSSSAMDPSEAAARRGARSAHSETKEATWRRPGGPIGAPASPEAR